MKITTHVTGIRETMRNARRIAKQYNKAFGAALYHEGQDILRTSQKLVPVDTGNLASTGVVTPPVAVMGRVAVTVRYGGSRAPYAVAQHERMDYRHTSPQQAKYLERPFMEAEVGMTQRIAGRTKALIKMGAGPMATDPTDGEVA